MPAAPEEDVLKGGERVVDPQPHALELVDVRHQHVPVVLAELVRPVQCCGRVWRGARAWARRTCGARGGSVARRWLFVAVPTRGRRAGRARRPRMPGARAVLPGRIVPWRGWRVPREGTHAGLDHARACRGAARPRARTKLGAAQEGLRAVRVVEGNLKERGLLHRRVAKHALMVRVKCDRVAQAQRGAVAVVGEREPAWSHGTAHAQPRA